jgi:hypothetical protein
MDANRADARAPYVRVLLRLRTPGVGIGTLLAICALALSSLGSSAGAAQRARTATEHFACSGPNSASSVCHFSTPSGNIRCVWTPSPESVACELLATGRAYRLRPSGTANTVHLKLKLRGETLPTNQQVVFPQSLSCRDTRTTMTCNQDYGLGEFKLVRGHSHAA